MNDSDYQTIKLGLENENLRQQNERLAFELKDLREEKPLLRKIRVSLPALTWLVSLVTLPVAVIKHFQDRSAARRSSEMELRREAARPFWDKQLGFYLEAAEKAAFIAISENQQLRREAAERFWILYWGPLAAVEDMGLSKPVPEVETAMVNFGKLLTPAITENREALRRSSLALAHAIRDAAGPAFEIQTSNSAGRRDPQTPPTMK